MANDDPTSIQKATAIFKGQMFHDSAGNLKNVQGDNRGSTFVTDQFTIANQQAETDSKSYYGYLAEDGSWYIQRSTRDGAVITYEYTKGSSAYDFSDREDKTYESFDTVF